MVATVTTVARVIAAAAYAAVAVVTVISGLKKGANRDWMIVEAVSWLTVGILFLTVPVEYIIIPAVLGVLLNAVPMLRGAKKRGQ
ncbi:MAG: hypothetical protein HFF26_09220 [Oscillospiraceae bacterium]|nr:hypothetical protein [Oscillospiraceae bacterium]